MSRKPLLLITALVTSSCTSIVAPSDIGSHGGKFQVSSLRDPNFYVTPRSDVEAGKKIDLPEFAPPPKNVSGKRAEDIITPEPKPRFDINQSEDIIDAVLKDGKQHPITVLFEDSLKVRIKKSASLLKASNGFGLEFGHDDIDAKAAITETLSKYAFESIAPIMASETDTEEQMASRERLLESKSGQDIPNDGSWASFNLADFSPQTAKELVLKLQKTSGIRCVELNIPVGPAAPNYAPTPNDPLFPDKSIVSDWRTVDFISNRTAPDNTKYETWWWNRHSFGTAWSYSKGGSITDRHIFPVKFT